MQDSNVHVLSPFYHTYSLEDWEFTWRLSIDDREMWIEKCDSKGDYKDLLLYWWAYLSFLLPN